MHLRKLVSVGLAAVLCLAVALPVFAQNNESKDYQAIQDQRDPKKQKDLIESFLTNYKTSVHRPDFDLQLMEIYVQSKDWTQMIKRADAFALEQGSADAASKSKFFTLAMEAGRQLGNSGKMNEFADRALAADPNNISVLMTMSRSLAENPPADASARATAMDKSLGYAQKAQKVAKPEKVSDADWQGTQTRLHGLLGLIYFNQNKFLDSGKELAEFLKTSPTDGVNQFRYGWSIYTQLQQTLANLQAITAEAQKAKAADDDLTIYIDRINKYNSDFESQRDVTIDAMAKALASGGLSVPLTTQARQVIEPLFKQKNNNSVDGLDPFIAAKKAELAALTPLPPAASPGRPGVGASPAPAPAGGGGFGGPGGGGRRDR